MKNLFILAIATFMAGCAPALTEKEWVQIRQEWFDHHAAEMEFNGASKNDVLVELCPLREFWGVPDCQ